MPIWHNIKNFHPKNEQTTTLAIKVEAFTLIDEAFTLFDEAFILFDEAFSLPDEASSLPD
jgi:hypothetical protein